MRLDPAGRDWQTLEIVVKVNDEVVVIDDWEASYDGGVTYSPATVLDGNPAWLVAGPDFDPDLTGVTDADYIGLPLGRTVPKVRAIDNPAVIIDNAPPIDVRA